MNQNLIAHANEFADLDRKLKSQRATSELEAYWAEIGPYGKEFDEPEAVRLVVGMARRYESALCHIAQQSPECRAIAMEALGLKSMEQVERMAVLRNR